MSESTIRYVVTIRGRNGLRTLFDAAQGRYTYATHAEAYDRLTAFSRESGDRINDLYGPGACASMQVRECECWPGHFDPKGIYFDDPAPVAEGGTPTRRR